MVKERATTLRNLRRLQNGQRWLTATGQRLRALDGRGSSHARDEFNRAIDAWVETERVARDSGQLEGCPIGPDGCDPDAPVRCGHCGGRVGLEVLFGIGYRRH